MTALRLIEPGPCGLYVEAGDFWIDPWKPVDRAVVTHAHGDHAAWGCERYLCSAEGLEVLRHRVHPGAAMESLPYGGTTTINGVSVSLHPAGHLLGSAQVRVEVDGRVEVVTGDYKIAADPTCTAFEPVRCHRLISECTFGLPIYRWEDDAVIADQINTWWRGNLEEGRSSVVLAYALGKAQRLLAMLDWSIGPIAVHGSVRKFVEVYREAGIAMPELADVSSPAAVKAIKGKSLVVAPPSTLGTPWLKKFGPFGTSFASGWMMVRGNRRRRGVDRGFVLSDHADFAGLLEAVEATGCESVGATHGSTDAFARYLREVKGLDADVVPTRYEGEAEEGNAAEVLVAEQAQAVGGPLEEA